MSMVITERELDKMEVEAEVIVSKKEKDFEESFAGKRKRPEAVREDQELEV